MSWHSGATGHRCRNIGGIRPSQDLAAATAGCNQSSLRRNTTIRRPGAASCRARRSRHSETGYPIAVPDPHGAEPSQCQAPTFSVSQAGNTLEIRAENGPVAEAKVTSDITLSVGPPWNSIGVALPDRSIQWSNGTHLAKAVTATQNAAIRARPAAWTSFGRGVRSQVAAHIALASPPPCRLFEFTPSRTGIHSARGRGHDRTGSEAGGGLRADGAPARVRAVPRGRGEIGVSVENLQWVRAPGTGVRFRRKELRS